MVLEPADGLGELGVVVLVVGAPRVLVEVGEAVGDGEVAPAVLALRAVGPLGQEAVDLDVVLVEGRVEAVAALRVDGGLGDGLLEAAAVAGVPGELVQAAGVGDELGVVDQGHGVPVLRQAVALAVLDEEVGETGLVLAEVDLVLVDERLDVQDLVAGHELAGSRTAWSVQTSGALPLASWVVKVLPVLRPGGLRELDGDARVGLAELVGAGLVGGQLLVVPQPVVEGDLAAVVA